MQRPPAPGSAQAGAATGGAHVAAGAAWSYCQGRRSLLAEEAALLGRRLGGGGAGLLGGGGAGLLGGGRHLRRAGMSGGDVCARTWMVGVVMVLMCGWAGVGLGGSSGARACMARPRGCRGATLGEEQRQEGRGWYKGGGPIPTRLASSSRPPCCTLPLFLPGHGKPRGHSQGQGHKARPNYP